jgi:hypothetical protein
MRLFWFAAPLTKLDLLNPRAPTSIIPRSKTHHHHLTTHWGVSPTPTIHTPVPTCAPNPTILEQRTKAAGQRAPPTNGTCTTTTESTSPEATTSHRGMRPESPLAHARRGAASDAAPPAQIETFSTLYRLSIVLPRPGGEPLAPEMITVSARRGARLAVVADAWHLEHDCEFWWHFFICPFRVVFTVHRRSL